MNEAEVLEAIRKHGWRAILTEQAKSEKDRRGLSLTDIRRALVTAKAVRQERDGWRVSGGATTKQGESLEPLIAGNGGILVLEL